jgi:hypothetical protein
VPKVSVKKRTEIAVAIATLIEVKILGIEAGMRISLKTAEKSAPKEYSG